MGAGQTNYQRIHGTDGTDKLFSPLHPLSESVASTFRSHLPDRFEIVSKSCDEWLVLR